MIWAIGTGVVLRDFSHCALVSVQWK